MRKELMEIMAKVDPNMAEAYFLKHDSHRPPMQWKVLNAIYYQHRTFEELAAETGYAIGTLKEHYSKAVRVITNAYSWQLRHSS